MKKIVPVAVFFIFLFVVMQSCKKDVQKNEITTQIRIDTTIVAGTDYQLSLAPYGDDDEIATITQQANDFSISQLENVTDVFNPVYHYVAPSKNSGTEQVVLAITQNPDSRRCNKDSTIITINFTIK